MNNYQLIDSGNQKKLERFGQFLIERPCFSALWRPKFLEKWKEKDAVFTRDPQNSWQFIKKLPASWKISLEGIQFKVEPTDFGHLGVFPEHMFLWKIMKSSIENSIKKKKKCKVLNLFAYTGGASFVAAKAGAEVCHLDASKSAITWAKENAQINQLAQAPIRWILDDAIKFMQREVKRNSFYDGIILDPPSFGRGAKKEVFKLEESIGEMLFLCKNLLVKDSAFFIFSCHTPSFTALGLKNLLEQTFPKKNVQSGEMFLPSKESFAVPSGNFALWQEEI